MELVASWPSRMPLREVAAWSRRVEALGFDVMHVPETVHDPFLVAALAAGATERLVLRTSMVVAFPRSPMVTAMAAWDVAALSAGRFQLGVASQVRGNIVGRFSTTWSEPAARLADYIRSLRAIFHAFSTGDGLLYEGTHYRFDKLQPYFDPGPLDVPAPEVWSGGVNQRMCEVAGELSDGFVCHPTNSHPGVLASVLLPALATGAARAGRSDGGPRLVANPQPLTGATTADLEEVRPARRRELAFLYSTPAYRRQLEVFGRGDLGEALSAAAKAEDWRRLESLFDDTVLDEVLVQGTYREIAAALADRYAGRCDGLVLNVPESTTHDAEIAAMVAACQDIPARGGVTD